MAKQPGSLSTPTKSIPRPDRGPGAPLGSRSKKASGVPAKKPSELNARSGQSPVEPPEPVVPSDKPGPTEPKLMPEAEAARKGGIMARVAPAPPGVLAEQPDPRTSYQVKPTDDTSPLIKIGPQKASPKPAASGIDVGPQTSTAPKPAAESKKPSAEAIPPKAQPKEKM